MSTLDGFVKQYDVLKRMTSVAIFRAVTTHGHGLLAVAAYERASCFTWRLTLSLKLERSSKATSSYRRANSFEIHAFGASAVVL